MLCKPQQRDCEYLYDIVSSERESDKIALLERRHAGGPAFAFTLAPHCERLLLLLELAVRVRVALLVCARLCARPAFHLRGLAPVEGHDGREGDVHRRVLLCALALLEPLLRALAELVLRLVRCAAVLAHCDLVSRLCGLGRGPGGLREPGVRFCGGGGHGVGGGHRDGPEGGGRVWRGLAWVDFGREVGGLECDAGCVGG